MLRRRLEGQVVSQDNYHYHEYTDDSFSECESYMDMVRALAKRVIYSDKMGCDKRIYDIYGLTAKDLGELDYAEFMRYKRDVDDIETEYIKKLEEQLREAEKRDRTLRQQTPQGQMHNQGYGI